MPCGIRHKNKAFAKKNLLAKDVRSKQQFYYVRNAHYETATIKDIQLVPADTNILKALEADYAAMGDMIYGKKILFSDIMQLLKKLETEIHHL